MCSKCIPVFNLIPFGRFPRGLLSGGLPAVKVPKCNTVVDFSCFSKRCRTHFGADIQEASRIPPGRSQDAPGPPPRAGNVSPDPPKRLEEPKNAENGPRDPHQYPLPPTNKKKTSTHLLGQASGPTLSGSSRPRGAAAVFRVACSIIF